MERKWTPGPWWINGQKSVRGPDFEYIANANWKNGKANAQMIAAAPDLYQALEEMVNEQVDYMTRNALGDPEKQFSIKLARAALAKARGEA